MKKAGIIIFSVIIVLLTFSCDLIGGGFLLPDYIGTWSREDAGMTITYTFAREEWELLGQGDILGTTYDLLANRGTLVNGGGKMTITTTHERKGDDTMGIIAPETEWTEITAAAAEAEAADPLIFTWAVAGDKLTLTAADSSEMVFTKVVDTEE